MWTEEIRRFVDSPLEETRVFSVKIQIKSLAHPPGSVKRAFSYIKKIYVVPAKVILPRLACAQRSKPGYVIM